MIRAAATPAVARREPLPRWFWPVVAGLVLLHLTLAWLLRTAAVGTGGDDAVYMQLARGLRHLTYQDTFLQGAPAHVKFPPGYPAFLALLSMFGGENFQLYVAGGILLSGFALALVTDTVRRLASPQLAVMVLVACVANPRILSNPGMVMSEALCLFFIALAFWGASRDRESVGFAVLAGAAACAAALTRSAAITIVLALAIYWVLTGRVRRAAVFAGVVVVVVGSWLLWTVVGPRLHPTPTGERYIADTFARTAGNHAGALQELAARVFRNSIRYLTRVIPAQLPLPYTSATILDNLAAVGAICLCTLAGIAGSWKRWRLLPIFVGGYVALLLIWPWPVSRFFSLILPFVFALLFIGAATIGGLLGARWRLLLPALFAGIIAVTAAAALPESLRAAAECDRANPEQSPGCFNANTREFIAVSRWAADSLPRSAVVVVVKEGSYSYFTGHKAVPFLRVARADSSRIMNQMRSLGATHIVLTHLALPELKVADNLLPVCGQLRLVRRFSPTAMILEIDQEGNDGAADARGSACEALSAYTSLLEAERQAEIRARRG